MSRNSRAESSYRMKIANKQRRKRKKAPQNRPKNINLIHPRDRTKRYKLTRNSPPRQKQFVLTKKDKKKK